LLHAAPAKVEYLKNDQIRIGVDLNSGGGICYFGESNGHQNLLNQWDKGRLIQQSYYGRDDGSMWVKTPWRWNAVQGGDYKGNASEVLEWRNDGAVLYVKTRPRHWATDELMKDVVMEEIITLEGDVAKLSFVCIYSGSVSHPVVHQELPAVFLDADLPQLRFYDGKRPWTGGALTTRQPGFPNEYFEITESWVAYTDAKDWGVGIYVPGVTQITAYRYRGNGSTGSAGDACSYVAPIRSFAFDKPMTFAYTAYLTLGKIDEIRARFQKMAQAAPKAAGAAR